MAELIISSDLGRARDLTGEKFGRYTAVRHAGYKLPGKKKSKEHYWECVCDCGEVRIVAARNMIKGTSRSCGCLKIELTKENNSTHKMSKTRIYYAWLNMIRRCTKEDSVDYPPVRRKGNRRL